MPRIARIVENLLGRTVVHERQDIQQRTTEEHEV
jgi:hypothetical protein